MLSLTCTFMSIAELLKKFFRFAARMDSTSSWEQTEGTQRPQLSCEVFGMTWCGWKRHENVDQDGRHLKITYIIEFALVRVKRHQQRPQIVKILKVWRNFRLNVSETVFASEVVVFDVQALVEVAELVHITVEKTRGDFG
jgi:hypothetical protein